MTEPASDTVLDRLLASLRARGPLERRLGARGVKNAARRARARARGTAWIFC